MSKKRQTEYLQTLLRIAVLSFTLVTKGKTLCRHITFSLFRNFYNKLKGYRHKYNQKQPPMVLLNEEF